MNRSIILILAFLTGMCLVFIGCDDNDDSAAVTRTLTHISINEHIGLRCEGYVNSD